MGEYLSHFFQVQLRTHSLIYFWRGAAERAGRFRLGTKGQQHFV